MRTVGIRTLKNRLSEYVRAVQSGERVTVTSRGTPVIDLVPHAPHGLDPDDELLRWARARESAPRKPERRHRPYPPAKKHRLPTKWSRPCWTRPAGSDDRLCGIQRPRRLASRRGAGRCRAHGAQGCRPCLCFGTRARGMRSHHPLGHSDPSPRCRRGRGREGTARLRARLVDSLRPSTPCRRKSAQGGSPGNRSGLSTPSTSATALLIRDIRPGLRLLSFDRRIRENAVALGFDVLPAEL